MARSTKNLLAMKDDDALGEPPTHLDHGSASLSTLGDRGCLKTERLVLVPNDFDRIPLVLTSSEAARLLRVGVKEIRQLVDRGEIQAAKCGPRRVIRIARSAIISFLTGKVA